MDCRPGIRVLLTYLCQKWHVDSKTLNLDVIPLVVSEIQLGTNMFLWSLRGNMPIREVYVQYFKYKFITIFILEISLWSHVESDASLVIVMSGKVI